MKFNPGVYIDEDSDAAVPHELTALLNSVGLFVQNINSTFSHDGNVYLRVDLVSDPRRISERYNQLLVEGTSPIDDYDDTLLEEYREE